MSRQPSLPANDVYSVVFGLALGSERPQVVAKLPETFEIAVSSNFDSPFADGPFKQVFSDTGYNLMKGIMGVSATAQEFSAQIWQGTNPIVMTLPLVFAANRDPTLEVRDPIKLLMRAALPRLSGGRKGGFLIPPGPKARYNFDKGIDSLTGSETSLLNGVEVLEAHSVRIGRFLRLSNIVITSVTPVFSTLLNSRGQPMKADCSVQFVTYQIPTSEDVNNMFE